MHAHTTDKNITHTNAYILENNQVYSISHSLPSAGYGWAPGFTEICVCALFYWGAIIMFNMAINYIGFIFYHVADTDTTFL